ncbi:MAG: 5-methyltetrahydropteroyltriglutamate--homocysteine S-methyltransferase, partial [Caldiserica bacterium]
MKTYAYGYPRLGKNREFKKIIEGYWEGNITEKEMLDEIKKLDEERRETYKEFVDIFPEKEITLYDSMLDMCFILGIYDYSINTYFELARGKNALPMKKWFNTNYHYLVPEIDKKTKFKFSWNKFADIDSEMPIYIIGGWTFLKLSKGYDEMDFKDILLKLKVVYKEIFENFNKIHLDEPGFVFDVKEEDVKLIKEFYSDLIPKDREVYLFTYYDSVDFLPELYDLPFKGIGLDFVSNRENFESIKRNGFPDDKVLIAGIVDGRNVWRSNIEERREFLKEISKYAKNIFISNASPLFHLPITVGLEEDMDEDLKSMLSFAFERLYELKLIKESFFGKEDGKNWYKKVELGYDEEVRNKLKELKDDDFERKVDYEERKRIQKSIFNLPLFPTTTIGSFPQSKEVRKKRRDFRTGLISKEEYENFIKEEIEKLVNLQEELELDVFVHGEFERTDMVEFFAEKLSGVATTKNGWIISYGTRGYRPPIIYGDVKRTGPMTIKEIKYAQSLTKKPVKGMITGPVTIIAWSYTRNDIPMDEVAYEISLALKDEVRDYISNGIKIIQIDEPAFREKAPIKKKKWDEYFEWAIKSFNLIANVPPEIQIHTHMCYSEFGEIINYINKLNFDVISIEASRSKAEILNDFKRVDFKKQIGLGIWDIHSPVIPEVEKMLGVVERALEIFEKENFWINPDCGLKTRKWEEVIPSLKNLVKVSKILREKYK